MATLTGKTIGQLTLLSGITNDTLFPVEYDSKTYHIPYSGFSSTPSLYETGSGYYSTQRIGVNANAGGDTAIATHTAIATQKQKLQSSYDELRNTLNQKHMYNVNRLSSNVDDTEMTKRRDLLFRFQILKKSSNS